MKSNKISSLFLLSFLLLSGFSSVPSLNLTTVKAKEKEISDIEGMQFWFDASSLDLKDGAKISSIKNLADYDLDGITAYATQSNITNQPTFVKNGSINGLSTMKFNSFSYLNFGSESGFYLDDLTMFAVIKADTAEGHHEFLSRLSSSPYDHNWFFNLEGGFNFGWGYENGGSSSYYQAKIALEDNTPYLLTGKRDGKDGYSYVNGWLESTFHGNVSKDSKQKFYIGDGGGTCSINAEVGEIICFNKALDDEELDLVTTYLQDKWNVKNDTDGLLKSLSVNGEAITGFYPMTYNYSLLAKESVSIDDITYTTYGENDVVDVSLSGKTFTVSVKSGETGTIHNYYLEVSALNYDYNEIKDLTIDEVTINDGYWGTTLTQYQDYAINYIFDMYDFTHSFDNFDRVANGERKWKNNLSAHAGQILIPSDGNRLIGDTDGSFSWGNEPWREGLIYECIAAASNFIISLGKKADTLDKANALKERMDGYIDRIYAAGLTTTGTDYKGKVIDGYFSTINLLTSNSVLDEASGGAIYNHDLYNFGCLLEAGINWYKATGDTRLLYLGTRFAEFVVDYIYGTEDQKGYMVVPPHAIAEETFLDLYDLYKNNPSLVKEMEDTYSYVDGLADNDRYVKLEIRLDKYLDVINAWVTEKGNYEDRYNNVSYGTYAQDQCDITEMAEALGHAVRANLFYSGVTAIGKETENFEYVNSMKRIWDNIVDTQLYVTGGTGASESLGEAYAGSYVLPQDGYCETCASVGMAFFADNMFELFGEAEYEEVLELELYNGVLGSLSQEGNALYYCNPLVSSNYQRPYWSGATPCCPPMYMKLYANLPTYIYAKSSTALYVNQYISSTADYKFNGKDVKICQYSDLPDGDMAKIRVTANDTFEIKLRIPNWASSYEVKIDNKVVNVAVGTDGYVTLNQAWNNNEITLSLGKEVIRLYQENVSYNEGQVAIQYGPFIYCAESYDNGKLLTNSTFSLAKDAEFEVEYNDEEFEFRIDENTTVARPTNILKTKVTVTSSKNEETATLTLIPFYLRGNRDLGTMRVWLDESKERITFEGTKYAYAFKDKDISMFDIYGGETCYRFVDKYLLLNKDKEYKLLYNTKKDLSEFEAGMTIKAGYTSEVNTGLYLYANNANGSQDIIDALNVQVEKAANASNYTISIYEFSSSSGYLGKLASSQNMFVEDGTIFLRVICKDGYIHIYNTEGGYPILSYKKDAAYSSGQVGIRSQIVASTISDFYVVY